jgi:hypothetical protein
MQEQGENDEEILGGAGRGAARARAWARLPEGSAIVHARGMVMCSADMGFTSALEYHVNIVPVLRGEQPAP